MLLGLFSVLTTILLLQTYVYTIVGSIETDGKKIEKIIAYQKNGEIRFDAKNNKAKSSWRWKTLGFRVTYDKIPENEHVKMVSNITDFSGRYEDFYYSEDVHKTEYDDIGDLTNTDYYFTEKYVLKVMGLGDQSKLTQRTKLYLHGIFQPYEYISDTVHNNLGKPIYDWSKIVNYRFPGGFGWPEKTKKDFYKYYNIELEWDPPMQNVEVYYKYIYLDGKTKIEDTQKIVPQKGKTSQFTAGNDYSYTANRVETYKNIEYEYVEAKGFGLSQNILLTQLEGYKKSDFSVVKNNDSACIRAMVPIGGLKLVITYKEIPKIPINYTRLAVTKENGTFTISDVLESESKLGEAKEGASFSWKGSTDPKITEQYQWKKGQKGKAVSGKAGEDIYTLFGYYISIGDKKQKTIESGKNSITLQDIMEGSIPSVKKGMTVNFLYEKAPKHPVSYVRELTDGTILQEETFIDSFYPNETCTWKVKAMLDYNEKTKTYREAEKAKDESSLELLRVKIIHNKDKTVLKTVECKGSTSYSGNFKVKAMGETIHYIYKKDETSPKQYPVSYQRETETGTILQSKKKLKDCFVGDEYEWKVKGYLSFNATTGACKEREDKEEAKYELVNVRLEYLKDQSMKTLASASGKTQYSGRFTVPKKGVLIHYVYKEIKEGTSKEHPVYYQRETETGTLLQDETLLGEYKKDETCQWSVKAFLSYNKETKSCREQTSKTTSNYELVRVMIEKRKDGSITSDLNCEGKTSYTGSFKVGEKGAVIRYIYREAQLPPRYQEDVPDSDVREASFAIPEVQGEIQADTRNSNKFDVSTGIPTTESLYVQVQGTKYLLGYTFTKRTGTVNYRVPIQVTHSLKWESAQGKPRIETYVQDGMVDVTRAFAYWEITNLDYYTIDSAKVNNYALPDGTVTIQAKSAYNSIPSLSYCHWESQSSHVLPPIALQTQSTIELPGIIVTGEKQKPAYEYYSQEQLNAMVDERVGSNQVKNDYLIFGGSVVMQDNFMDCDTGDINESPLVECEELCGQDCVYQSDYIIDATKLNGQYYSSGTISYRCAASVNSKYYGNPLYYSISNLNSVVIHTPVYCKPEISVDNDRYVQLLNPSDDCIPLVLDENSNLNDFSLHISNSGTHSELKGYRARDFSYNQYDGPIINNRFKSYLQEKNGVLRNEVKFPFDVYLHASKDKVEYVPKGTWIVLGRATVTFHLPMWVNEGTYQVDCRSIAVNCTEQLISNEEVVANRNRVNYVATNQFSVEVSGRIYGFHVYDLTDYPIWQEVFRENNSLELKWNHKDQFVSGVEQSNYSNSYYYNYAIGTKNQYGEDTKRLSKYTLPLVSGSHPKYKNIGTLKKGYGFRFSLDTIGNAYSDACKVIIKPTFWHVDADGKNRIPVDLYYDEEVNGKLQKLVKVGESLDAINLKQYRIGDPYLAIPENELQATAKLRNETYLHLSSSQEAMFSFGEIRLNSAFRTFVNQEYREEILHSEDQMKIEAKGIHAADIDIRKQRWYGEYYLPGTVKVVQSGFDVMDYAKKYGVDDNSKFWIKDGYLIVNFDIVTIGEDGKERLSYTNAENYLKKNHCCMYLMEGYELEKQDFTGTRFSFLVGDVMIYEEKKNVKQDYKIGGSH